MGNEQKEKLTTNLFDYFKFTPCPLGKFLEECKITNTTYPGCSTLIKKEAFVESSLEANGEDDG